MTPAQLLSVVVVGALFAVFPVLLIYGLLAGRILTVVGTTTFQRLLLRATGTPPEASIPWVASRLEQPRRYWAAIALYGFLSVCGAVFFALIFFVRDAP